MKYRVLQRFTDADNGNVYDVGDKYPANTKKARLKALLSDDVKDHDNFNSALIEEVSDNDDEANEEVHEEVDEEDGGSD